MSELRYVKDRKEDRLDNYIIQSLMQDRKFKFIRRIYKFYSTIKKIKNMELSFDSLVIYFNFISFLEDVFFKMDKSIIFTEYTEQGGMSITIKPNTSINIHILINDDGEKKFLSIGIYNNIDKKRNKTISFPIDEIDKVDIYSLSIIYSVYDKLKDVILSLYKEYYFKNKLL